MKVEGVPHRTIWVEPDGWSVGIIDQTRLPHRFAKVTLRRPEEAARELDLPWVAERARRLTRR